MATGPRHRLPPERALRLLQRYAPPSLLEAAEGDLEELYADRRERHGPFLADLWFWKEVLLFLRWHGRRHTNAEKARGPIMLRNYLTVALRAMRRHPGYAFLNIAGLAVGLACCLLIALFVRDELSFDRFHENADDLYRIVKDEHKEGGLHVASASTPILLADLLREDMGGIEQFTRLLRYSVFTKPLVGREGQEPTVEPGFFFADSSFFGVFSFALRYGDPTTALAAPFSVVLTAFTAKKYFGDVNPVGQTLLFEKQPMQVTGVLEDLPQNSHLQFDLLGSFSTLGHLQGTWLYRSWHWPPAYTYVRAGKGQAQAGLETAISEMLSRRLRPDLAAQTTLSLQPLPSIHLHSHRSDELGPNSDVAYVWVFSIIALFILLIACINFMNLATARATARAKEVGMRKALGAQRAQLIRQFLVESLLTGGIALALAVVLAVLALPAFNYVAGKTLVPGDLLQGPVVLVLGGIVMLVGLLAGSYPALYLSAFRPARVLKDTRVRGSANAWLRKGLVVGQFTLSCALLVGTVVAYNQLHFLQTKKLGFDKEHVLVARLGNAEAQTGFPALKQAWLQHPNVQRVTATSDVPPSTQGLYDFPVVVRGERADSLEMLTLTVDHDFAETFGLEVISGRDLDEAFPTDLTEGFLLNESAAKRLGLDDPVGQELTLYHYASEDGKPARGRVVGIVKDFHYASLRSGIDPLLFFILPVNSHISYYSYLSVRVRPEGIQETVAYLEQAWRQFEPERPFDYTFLDTQFDALYRAEQRLASLFGYFAALAIFTACLGLFGLAAYTTQQRTKEVGIRKVMGASVPGLVILLSREFVQLVLVAFVLAVPLAYFAMQQWLEGFAYRVPIGAGTFLMAGLAALLIALVTVSYQAWRAARTNPVEALRYE